MIPTVLILAYFHGARGQHRWNKAEKIIIPANIFLSAALLIFLFYGRDLGAATKTVIYIDDDGLTIERTIPKSEFRKKIALTYFDNETGDPELDWLQYGIVKALQIDLGQDLYLNVGAGFDPRLKQSGYLEGVGVPLTLKREIAQDRHLDYFVSGSFTEDNEEFTVNTSLYETKRMKLLKERSFTGKDIFKLADEISVQLKHDLDIPAYHIGETEDKPVTEMLTNSMSAFRLCVIGNYMNDIKSDWIKASDYLKQAVDDDPTFAYAWFDLSTAYMQLNQGEKAEKAIRSAMQHDYKLSEKDKFEAKYIYYYIYKQDQDMVFSLAKRRVELFPEDIQGHEWLAGIYKGRNQLDEALSEYELMLDLDPELYNYLQEIAKIYVSKGEFEKALDFYKQYANQFPDNPDSFTAIGDLYKNLGDHEQAKAYYKKAILIEPENIRVLITLAGIESDLGNFKQALEQYHEILELCKTPNQRSQVFRSFRQYYEMRGQFNRALDYIQRAKAEDEKYMAPVQLLLNDVGYLETYINAGKQSFAFEALKKMEGKVVPFLEKLLSLGYMQVYLAIEDADNAEKTIEGLEEFIKSWGIESFRYFIFFAQGRINEIRGGYEQAILDYQKSFEHAPTEFMILESMGRCFRKLKEYEKAEKSLQDALKIRPFNPRFNYEIALVYWDWGNKEKALAHLNRALYVWEEADPEYKLAREARAKLPEWQ
jgi:tetratricopeptide (TPR) repeat protein/TolB-like protein